MVKTVVVSGSEDFRKVLDRATDAEVLGRIISRVLESQAQRSFLQQRLGEYEWPERYPSMDDPFVNLAALVNWTNSGGGVLDRFFDRRPALIGTGNLTQSISSRITRGFIETGSALPYAGIHQHGGDSTLPVTDQAKKTIGSFIGMENKGGEWVKKKRMGARQAANREKFFFKLAPMLGMSELSTQVNARPFLGITPENESEMAESIEDFVATGSE
jgi:phage gpG-like protein